VADGDAGHLGHRQATGDGRGSSDSDIPGGDATTRKTPGLTRHSRWAAAGSDPDGQSTRSRQGRAPIPGDQTAIGLPENPATWHNQEPLQGQSDHGTYAPNFWRAACC